MVNVSAGGCCMPVPQMTVYSATKVNVSLERNCLFPIHESVHDKLRV